MTSFSKNILVEIECRFVVESKSRRAAQSLPNNLLTTPGYFELGSASHNLFFIGGPVLFSQRGGQVVEHWGERRGTAGETHLTAWRRVGNFR